MYFQKSFRGREHKRVRYCVVLLLCFYVAAISLSSISPLHSLPPIGDQATAAGYMPIASNGTRPNIITIGNKMKKEEALGGCRNSSNYCEMEGDIRIEPNSTTVIVKAQNSSGSSWMMEPYPRNNCIKKWTIKVVQDKESNSNSSSITNCSEPQISRAILFSVKGFTGNYFHDFADVLFPLYVTSSHFEREVQFLVTDYQLWWINKYRDVLNKLTKHKIIDIDGDTSQVHCYRKIHIGLKFQRELRYTNPNPNPNSPTMMQKFRRLLRQAYYLERETTTTAMTRLPRLMIISRKRKRIIKNESGVARMAREMGFEVVMADAGVSTNVTRYAQLVNSCDAIVGVHGAGLTNMVFLPDNAVLIQLVPHGVDRFAKVDFEEPAPGMNIRYLKYKISVNETSFSLPIPKNPKIKSFHQLSALYLHNNVTIDLNRLNATFAKALYLLRH